MKPGGAAGADEEVKGRLRELGERFGEALSERQQEQLVAYMALLLEWNRSINLTGARTWQELAREHLPDSFALVRLVGPARDLLDVGSGGGLPGVPAGILRPTLRVTLSEPRSRRRAFLTQAVHRLGLSEVRIVEQRAERLGSGHAVAVARAVFSPAEWLEVGSRLVADDGRVVVLIPAEFQWSIPPGVQVLDEVRYSAGARERLALACSVPRGTKEAGRST